MIWFLILLSFLLISPMSAWAVGYVPRPCGFDLDDDNIIGEASDCVLCNGVTTDPDGDTVDEDLIYIDCGAGTDGASCGTPASPCKTIAYAISSRADGPGDGAEDILCIKGTCLLTAEQTLSISGVAGGHELQDGVQVPNNPFMIVGWDADGDGSYPPYDTDDTAIIDGDQGGGVYTSDAFGILTADYVEMAHLTINEFGREKNDGNFVRLYGTGITHTYFHDLELVDVLRAADSGGTVAIFATFGDDIDHHVLLNIQAGPYCSYFMRGSPASSSYWLLKDISVTGNCPAGESMYFWDVWDSLDHVYVLDNYLDATPEEWDGHSEQHANIGFQVAPCTQDMLVRNNTLLDWRGAITLQPDKGATYCQSRPLTNITFDRNTAINTYAWGGNGILINLSEGSETVGTARADTITFTNNMLFLQNVPTIYSCAELDPSNGAATPTGSITLVHNTIRCSPTSRTILRVFKSWANAQQNFVVKNNVFISAGGSWTNTAVKVEGYAPSGWSADYNRFDSTTSASDGYHWNGSDYGLVAWKAASNGDANSEECDPTFVTLTDLHLQPSDTCAIDNGDDLSAVTTVDVDGQSRPYNTSWDIGADEYWASCHGGRQ